MPRQNVLIVNNQKESDMKISILATAAILAFSTGSLFANPVAANGGQEVKMETGSISKDTTKVHQAKVASHKSHKHSARAHQKKMAKVSTASPKRIVKNSSLKNSHRIGQVKSQKKST